MFLSISSDRIHFLWPKWEETLPFFQIEKNFWPRILNILQKHDCHELFVLNGPGSFTTLRVCCLALSLIKKHTWIILKTTTKIDLFHDLAVHNTQFPKSIGVTIGQKNNCRILETHTTTSTKISYSEWSAKNIPHDPIHTIPLPWHQENIMYRQRNTEKNSVDLCLQAHKRTIDFSHPLRKTVHTLTPAYLIDPTMG